MRARLVKLAVVVVGILLMLAFVGAFRATSAVQTWPASQVAVHGWPAPMHIPL